MLKGISHITLAVKDLETSFNFYKDVLGFKPLMKKTTGAYFLAGDLWFCLNLDPNRETQTSPEYTHFAFDVNESGFKVLSENITKYGSQIWQDNTSEGHSLYFLDPDGHKLEIHVGDWQSRIKSMKAMPGNSSTQYFI